MAKLAPAQLIPRLENYSSQKKQLDALLIAKQQGMTIVPTKLLTTKKFIKVVIALGKGKKRYDKRETIKRRDQERDARRSIAQR